MWLQTIDYEILTSTQAVPMLTVADIDDVFVPVIDLKQKDCKSFASLTKSNKDTNSALSIARDFETCRLDLLYGKLRL